MSKDNTAFNEFWHKQIPVDSLCLYRLGVGVFLCFEACGWLPFTRELFSNQGFHIGVFERLAPTPFWALALCWLLVVFAAMVAAGFRTHLAIFSSLILLVFLNGIDTINEKAVHTVLEIALLFLLLCPCGARYSLDDILRQKKRIQRLSRHTCAFPLRLLQIYFAQTYFFFGLVKRLNGRWVHGLELAPILRGRWASDAGVWVSGAPDIFIQAASLATILYELFAGFLLFVPWARDGVRSFGILFHLIIQVTLNVEYLGAHFIWALMILFGDPEIISRQAVSFRRVALKFVKQYVAV